MWSRRGLSPNTNLCFVESFVSRQGTLAFPPCYTVRFWTASLITLRVHYVNGRERERHPEPHSFAESFCAQRRPFYALSLIPHLPTLFSGVANKSLAVLDFTEVDAYNEDTRSLGATLYLGPELGMHMLVIPRGLVLRHAFSQQLMAT